MTSSAAASLPTRTRAAPPSPGAPPAGSLLLAENRLLGIQCSTSVVPPNPAAAATTMLTGAGFVQPPAVRPLALEGMTVDPVPRRHSRLAFGGAEHERRQMDKQR